MSCTLWMIGQFEWTYYEVYQTPAMPTINGGDVIFFLKGIPSWRRWRCNRTGSAASYTCKFGLFEFCSGYSPGGPSSTLSSFSRGCTQLLPRLNTNYNYDVVTNVQNMVIVIGLGVLC